MSIKCGNPKHGGIDIRHETVADVRACYASPNGVADFAPTTEGVRFPQAVALEEPNEVWPWAEPGETRKLHHNPFTQLGAAYAEILRETPIEVAENGPAQTPGMARLLSSCSGRNEPVATVKQRDFIRILLGERDLNEGLALSEADARAAKDVEQGFDITMSAARFLITALKDLPKVAPKNVPEQPWRLLSREVPAGNYCVEIDGKNHFYRVSVGDNGFYKVQERASDELYFIPVARYKGILQSILDATVEGARLRYATQLSRCWHCHRSLTDNVGNPHYSRGLGPYCGDEH